jgi:tungstate transport system permease protein
VDALWDGLIEALRLIVHGDRTLREVAIRTIAVSGVSTMAAAGVGVPLGYALSRARFRGRTIALGLLNTGMGLPPVVVGLVVWLMLVRSGPFGGFELVYTKRGMIIAQVIIATPLVIGFSAAAFQALPSELGDLLASLGARRMRTLWLLAREARLGLFVAVMAGFGGAISEVGASMVVGGNLQGSTRVLTTAIVTETSRGQNDTAIAYGIVLLGIAFAVNLALTTMQQRSAR